MLLKTILLDLLFPPRCPICGEMKEHQDICPQCQESMPWIGAGEHPAQGEFFQDCYAPLWYRGQVRASFHRFKFGGRRIYDQCYATLMVQCIEDRLEPKPDYIVWAPISRRRLGRRGYDQSLLLAREVSNQLEIPLLHGLEKWRDTPPQSTLHEISARRANSLGAYRMRKDVSVEGKNLLLIDDVLTSGSTLSECARILRTAGAAQVRCLTFARADQREKVKT